METSKLKIIALLALGWLIAVSIYSLIEGNAGLKKLGQFNLTNTCTTSTSTSTFNWLTPGTGTTTLTCSTTGARNLRVNLILIASSTQTAFKMRVERSMDYQDWFSDLNPLNELSTTTLYMSGFGEHLIYFASSTSLRLNSIDFNGQGTTTINYVNLMLPTTGEDWTRFTFYQDPLGVNPKNTNGALRIGVINADENR